MSISTSLKSREQNRTASNLDQKEINAVLEGNFMLDHQPLSRAIRLFISSEFTDMSFESPFIVNHMFPALRSHCQSLGLQFYGIDLYNSIPSLLQSPPPDSRIHDGRESSECLEKPWEERVLYQLEREGMLKLAIWEIKKCQIMSTGPNFVTLLAQKYGYRPLHSSIPQEDFELLYASIEELSARHLVQQWYILDTNSQPPKYLLQPWDPAIISLDQWISIHDSLSRTLRKAAKIALGKDVSKVQHYTMSAIEEEITCGIFSLKQNPNHSCFWFKRVFTDLHDQRLTDTSLSTYTDMSPGKKGMEFDSEALKALNHLKEARLPAKYVGLDVTNIFEYPLKWQKGKGLDPVENPVHAKYLQDLSCEMIAALKANIDASVETLDYEAENKVFQEVVYHNAYCKKKAKVFMDRPSITEKLFNYISSKLNVPVVIYGELGSGKTHIIAGTVRKLKEKFPLQKMILIVRFIGITPDSFSIRKTLRSICEQLAAVLDEDPFFIPGDLSSITGYFKTLLCRASSERPIYIFLDGVDQLSPEDGASGMSWLPLQLPLHVKVIVSTSSEIKYRCYPVLQSLLSKQTDTFIQVPLLSKEECKQMLSHQLALKRRTLTRDQMTATMMVVFLCPLPLYLDLILIEVEQWKSYFGSRPWENAAPPTTLNTILEKIFDDLEAEFGKFFSKTASYISASKHGLTEMEILDLLSCNSQVMEDINQKWKERRNLATESWGHYPQLKTVPSLLWSQVCHRLGPITEPRMGSGGVQVIQWSHKYLTEYASSRYLGSEHQRKDIYDSLADYFMGKYAFQTKENEEDRKSDSTREHLSQPLFWNVEKKLYNARKLSELPFCLARSGRMDELKYLLMDYNWLKGKIFTSSCAEVMEDFAVVLPVVPVHRSQSDNNESMLRLLRDALSLSLEALNTDPTQLPAQLYGRLLPSITKVDTESSVLKQLLVAALQDAHQLLMPLQHFQKFRGGPLLVTMKGHRDAISCVAVTSVIKEETGKKSLCILSSSWDKTLKSWDLDTNGVLKTFDGHTDRVLSVALTEDSLYVTSGSADATVRYWHVPTAKCVYTLRGHTAAVNTVVLTTNGSKTISGSTDCTIKVWNTDLNGSSCYGGIIFTLKTHKSPVLCMALLSDRYLASGAKKGVVLVTDIISGVVLHTFKGHDGPITSLAIVGTDSDDYLLSGTESGTVSVRIMGSGKLIHSLQSVDITPVNSIAASSNGKVMISYGHRLSLWHLQNGHHLYDISGQSDSILGVTLADQGNLALTGSKDSSLQIWDLLDSPLPQDTHDNDTTSVSISPCGSYGVSGGNNYKLKIHDLKKNSIVREVKVQEGRITQVLVLRDSEHILVAYHNGSIEMWNGFDQELVQSFDGCDTAVNSIAVSADSELLMSGSESAAVIFWSMKTGKKLKTFSNHTTAVVHVAFCQDYMISASRDGVVCIRNFNTGKVISTLATVNSLLGLAISPNAAFFVTGSLDKNCQVINLQTGILKSTLEHKGPVTCLKVLSNCTQCLTGSELHLRIWNVENGNCVAMLHIDAPITSCDINLKNDCIFYGTKGGWVSTAVYRTCKRENGLFRLQGATQSDTSFTESGSETTEINHEEEVIGKGDIDVNVSSTRSSTQDNWTKHIIGLTPNGKLQEGDKTYTEN